MIKNFYDFLNESKNYEYLYHFTSFNSLTSILKSGLLKMSDEIDEVPDEKYLKNLNIPLTPVESKKYVSLTRNRKLYLEAVVPNVYQQVYIETRITLDALKLTQKYKIFPHFYKYAKKDFKKEYEERLYANRPNQKSILIGEYIKEITIFKDLYSYKDFEKYLEEIKTFVNRINPKIHLIVL